jgi:hypothetical protein
MATTEINKTKILVKVHEPLLAIMQHKIDAACLKRDAYLDKALRVEAEFLRKEIATPNSDKAKNYIAAQLSDLKLKPLNLLLSTETVDLINEVCKEKNVPRDAFLNRFFLLLIANDTILTALFHEFLEEGHAETIEEFLDGGGWTDLNIETGVYLEHLFITNNAVDAIESFITKYSPFGKIRLIMNKIADDNEDNEKISQYKDAMYSFPFESNALKNLPDDYDFLKLDNALGFNPFMTDEQIEAIKLVEEISALFNKKDRLAEIMAKEKQARAGKEKQARLAKLAKLEGDAK